MTRTRNGIMCLCIATLLLSSLSLPALGAAATVRKSVTPMDDGKFLIRLSVTAATSSIYALTLIDPQAAIVDVYAPRSWCVATDGEDLIARTADAPIKTGQATEFIIHSNTDQISYTFTVWNKMKQLGAPGTI